MSAENQIMNTEQTQPPPNLLDPDDPFLEQQGFFTRKLINNLNQEIEPLDQYNDSKNQSMIRLYFTSMNQYLSLLRELRKQKTVQKKETQKFQEETLEFPPSWQTDIVLFAQQALNTQLFDHQKEFCLSHKRTNILIAGRGAGKSVCARVKALHKAFSIPNHTVLVVSSGQRMSSDFGRKLLDLVRESECLSWVKSISNEEVQCKNGSLIKLLPANPDTIRGYHPRHTGPSAGMTVILDEACFMEQGSEIRKAVEYALITTSNDCGQIYIVSSPSTTGSWVYDYVQQAQHHPEDFTVIQTGSAANPTISAEELERLKKTKNEMEYRAEVLGEWVDGAYGLFSGMIDPNLIPASEPIPDYAEFALGADLALSYSPTHDRNALAVIAYWPDDEEEEEMRYRLVDLSIHEGASDREIRQQANQFIEEYNIRTAAVEQFQGKALSEYCQSLGVDTFLVSPTSALQQSIFHEMHRLLKQKFFQFPENLPPLFFNEMKSFEYRREANGHISFGHTPSSDQHDDTVYAAAWALYASLQQISTPKHSIPPPIISFLPKR